MEEIITLPSGVQYRVVNGKYAGLVGNMAQGGTVPTQTREELESALDEAVQTDTDTFKYSGGKTGKTVTFDDGSVLTQRGYSFKYEDADGNPIDLDLKPGLKQSVDSKNEALGVVVRGIKSDLTKDVYGQFGGEEGALVSEYLADEAADAQRRAAADERKDEAMFGEGGRMDQLNEQVQKEAQALGLTTDEYYDLPLSQRLSMAAADIGEVFDPSQGELFQNPDDIDPDNSRSLGTLGSENLAEATKAARDYYDDIDTSADSPFFEIPDVSGAVDDPMYGVGVYTPPDDDYSGSTYDDLGGALTNLPADAVDFDYPLAGGVNIPGTNITITAGDPVGPGAGSNTGSGGDGNGGQPDDDFNDIGDGIGGGDTGINIGVIDPIGTGTGTGGGTGTGTSPTGLRESAYGLTLDDVLVPSTVNYGTDPRFANLAPTFKVSEATMPVFNRANTPQLGQTLPEGYKIINDQVYKDPNIYQETDAGIVGTQLAPIPVGLPPTSLLAEGGIVSLAEGGTPMDQFTKDFFIRLIPEALNDPNTSMARRIARIHQESDLGIDDETFRSLKYYKGFSQGGVASLSDTARNMFRPMVS